MVIRKQLLMKQLIKQKERIKKAYMSNIVEMEYEL